MNGAIISLPQTSLFCAEKQKNYCYFKCGWCKIFPFRDPSFRTVEFTDIYIFSKYVTCSTYIKFTEYSIYRSGMFRSAGPSGRSPAEIVGSNPTGGHGCLFIAIVVCCQVEVSAGS